VCTREDFVVGHVQKKVYYFGGPEIALGQAYLTLKFFTVEFTEKKVYLGDMSILSILLNIESECHRSATFRFHRLGYESSEKVCFCCVWMLYSSIVKTQKRRLLRSLISEGQGGHAPPNLKLH
jgi:hypothetical protein